MSSKVKSKKKTTEQVMKKRKRAREAQRQYYQKNKTGNPVGRPTLVPKELREHPAWNKLYARLYGRLMRAVGKLPEKLRPTGKLKIAEALATVVRTDVTSLPDRIQVEDRAGQVWEYSAEEGTLRCLTKELSALKKIKQRAKRRGKTS